MEEIDKQLVQMDKKLSHITLISRAQNFQFDGAIIDKRPCAPVIARSGSKALHSQQA